MHLLDVLTLVVEVETGTIAYPTLIEHRHVVLLTLTVDIRPCQTDQMVIMKIHPRQSQGCAKGGVSRCMVNHVFTLLRKINFVNPLKRGESKL